MKRSEIRRESRKGASRRRVYSEVRKAVWERSGGRCEIRATWSCTGACEDVHHKQGRIGDRLTDLDKMVGICRNCHEFIGRNPALAYDRGWMLKRNVKERDSEWDGSF